MFQSGSEGRAAQQCAVLTRLLSPLLANIALSVLDEHVMAPWQPDAEMGTTYRRHRRRQLGLPTWRIVRYADDCAPRTRLEVAM
jgi:retron-type reverse transcriptase